MGEESVFLTTCKDWINYYYDLKGLDLWCLRQHVLEYMYINEIEDQPYDVCFCCYVLELYHNHLKVSCRVANDDDPLSDPYSGYYINASRKLRDVETYNMYELKMPRAKWHPMEHFSIKPPPRFGLFFLDDPNSIVAQFCRKYDGTADEDRQEA